MICVKGEIMLQTSEGSISEQGFDGKKPKNIGTLTIPILAKRRIIIRFIFQEYKFGVYE